MMSSYWVPFEVVRVFYDCCILLIMGGVMPDLVREDREVLPFVILIFAVQAFFTIFQFIKLWS